MCFVKINVTDNFVPNFSLFFNSTGEKIKECEGTEKANKDTENKKYEGDKEDKNDEQDEGK